MKRRLAALLTCALIAFGQRSRTPEPASSPSIRFVDFLAFDAAGRPVSDLGANDFEVLQSGQPRKVVQYAWFDTRHHTARGSEAVPLALAPDEIRRNFVAIVDDLGLSAAGIEATRETLRGFVKDQMGSGDRMAVLRASSGSGDLQQLTGDRRILTAAIDRIQFVGGSVSAQAASGATWLTMRYALQGLHHFPGRKFVVVFSPNLRTPVRDPAAGNLFAEANAAMATVYAAGSGDVGTPLEALLRETGGAFRPELGDVLGAEEGFYVLGFEEPPSNLGTRKSDDPVSVKVRREGVTVRARTRYASVGAREDFPVPAERAVQIRRALASPYEAADIHTRLTAGFVAYTGQNAAVEANVLIGAGDLAIIRDGKGVHRGSVRMMIEARSELGKSLEAERSVDIAMPAADYQRALRDGFLNTVTLPLPAAGAWQIRVVVADGISDRLGSSVQCIEVPEANAFSMSALKLRAADPAEGKGPPVDPAETEAVRIFRTFRTLQFQYSVYNALVDDTQQSRVEVRTRLYGQGRAVFVGAPSQIVFPGGPGRLVTARLALGRDAVAGDYIMEVTVTDKAAPENSPRSITSFIDFKLRE